MSRRFQIVILVLLLLLIALPPTVGAESCGTHRVVRGENLFRLSLRYKVSMTTLAGANNISNIHLIYAGEMLTIPCAGATQAGSQTTSQVIATSTPQPSVQTSDQPALSGSVDCPGFRATSPVDGLNNGNTIFYWDPPDASAEIARYQVRILNSAGYEVAAYEILNIDTSLSADMSVGAIGPGDRFAWYVVGVTADERLCHTQLVHVPREWTGLFDG